MWALEWPWHPAEKTCAAQETQENAFASEKTPYPLVYRTTFPAGV